MYSFPSYLVYLRHLRQNENAQSKKERYHILEGMRCGCSSRMNKLIILWRNSSRKSSKLYVDKTCIICNYECKYGFALSNFVCFRSGASAVDKPGMKGRNTFTIGAFGLLFSCYAISLLWKKVNRSRYQRLSSSWAMAFLYDLFKKIVCNWKNETCNDFSS